MSASLLAKIKRANARTEESPQTPKDIYQDPANPPNPPKPRQEIAGAKDWSAKRTRGRPRNTFAKHRVQQHPVDSFVENCLLPAPACSEFLGTNASRAVETVTGDFVRVAPKYRRITLTEAYLQHCVETHHISTLPRTFTGLLLKSCLERGWAVRLTKAGDSRRSLIVGVSIKGQTPFDGVDDRGMNRPDRRRWKKKSDA